MTEYYYYNYNYDHFVATWKKAMINKLHKEYGTWKQTNDAGLKSVCTPIKIRKEYEIMKTTYLLRYIDGEQSFIQNTHLEKELLFKKGCLHLKYIFLKLGFTWVTFADKDNQFSLFHIFLICLMYEIKYWRFSGQYETIHICNPRGA